MTDDTKALVAAQLTEAAVLRRHASAPGAAIRESDEHTVEKVLAFYRAFLAALD